MKTDPESIDCEEAVRRLAEFLDRELPDRETAEVELHLERCRSCFSRAEFERRLKARVRQELRISDVSAESMQRIRTVLSRFQAAG